MSGQSVGQFIGTIIGTIVGGPIGGAIGGSIGGSVGSSFDTLPTRYGPRLDDLRVQSSTYGSPIPIVYGTVALQGTIIWAKDIKEVKTETEEGGKGGGPSQTTVTYSYFGTFAVAICEGPIGGVLRIWAGPEKRLIYDGIALEGGSLRIYLGNESQLPDPVIEADKGVGLTPAYRGTAYIVFEDYPLANDGNRLPMLTIEVTTVDDGGTCGTDYTVVNGKRLYDVPPIKLGNFGSGPTDADRAYLSSGEHPTVVDNSGNLYVLLYSYDGSHKWSVKRVSTNSPIKEDILSLGWQFNSLTSCSMAYDPNANAIGIVQEDRAVFALIDCDAFTVSHQTMPLAKRDIIYSENEQQFRFLDAQTFYVNGELSRDCYGIAGNRFDGRLIECGPHGIVVSSVTGTFQNGSRLTSKILKLYDPIRDRLLGVEGGVEWLTGYYDFTAQQTVTPAALSPTLSTASYRLNAAYFPLIDRILWTDVDGLWVMNPADFSAQEFPDECKLFGGQLLYADGSSVNSGYLYPVPIARERNRVAVVSSGNSGSLGRDIFTFTIGVRGKGVTLASVVADLSERAGESRYDVSQLESDIVDGYIIARQTQVRAAIDVLRPAYYFDAVESQGIIKYVKRGGNSVTVITGDDLAAHDAGGETGDPLKTARRMEVELPRAVNVKYMLAADDYSQAAKQARRLIGSSGDEQTVDVPLVLTDAKAQEVAEVNLHAPWAERLSYEFSLPRKYSYLEPTDLILVKNHLMRITKITGTPRGVLQCEAVSDESSYYDPHVVVTETQQREQTISQPGVTLVELF